jgi:hypothetical protein
MMFGLFNFNKKTDYYRLSFYNGFASQQNAAILGSLLFERFYSVTKLEKKVSKQVVPFGRYLLACLVVTKYNSEGKFISQVSYFELTGQNDNIINNRLIDDDINYLSELLYSKPA